MPKINSFVISESFESIQNQNGTTTRKIVNPLIALRPKFLPTDYSFYVSFAIVDIDLSKQIKLRIVLRDPKNQIVNDLSTILQPAKSKDYYKNVEEKFKGRFICLNCYNTHFSQCGCYKIEIIIDGKRTAIEDVPVFNLPNR